MTTITASTSVGIDLNPASIIELVERAAILAEGLPCETCLDTGIRAALTKL